MGFLGTAARARITSAVSHATSTLLRRLAEQRKWKRTTSCEPLECRVMLAATDPFGNGSHYFDQAPFSTANLNTEVVRANPNATGTHDSALSAGNVRLFDGQVTYQITDLSSNGFGGEWSVTRTWSPDMQGVGTLGNHWYLNQAPQLVQDSTADLNRPSWASATIILVSSGTDQRWFDRNSSGTWIERYGGSDTLVATTDPDSATVFVLTDPTGTQTHFYDFNPANGAQVGQFRSMYDPYGNVTQVTSVNSNGQITEIRRSNGNSIESWLYTFSTLGSGASVITNVQLRRSTDNGVTWAVARQVVYNYYISGDAGGNANDLAEAIVEDPSGNSIEISAYRYWLGTENVTEGTSSILQPVSALKYVLGWDAFGRMDALWPYGGAGGGATESMIATYADDYFAYDSSSRVYQQIANGLGGDATNGKGTFTFAYSSSSNSADFNQWSTKAVVTKPDGNTDTVYSNYAGEPMLDVTTDTTSGNMWGTFYKYNSNGQLILTAMPSAVSLPSSLSTLEAYADLLHSVSGNYQYLNDSTGLIDLTTYYTSTGNGGVSGYFDNSEVQQGETGTPVLQETRTYTNHSNGSVTIYPVSSDTVYRNTDGTGGQTTTYQYNTWFSGTNQPQNIQVIEPFGTAAQNGPGGTLSEHFTYDQYNNIISHSDRMGSTTNTSYDITSGAVTQTVVDAGTGHLNLTTTYGNDLLGRATTITDPNGNVTYKVYNDAANLNGVRNEVRTYPGWHQIGTTGTYTTDGPVTVTRQFLTDNGTAYVPEEFDTLTTVAPVESTSTPAGNEDLTFGLESLTRQLLQQTRTNIRDRRVLLSGRRRL
jgi:hypothetical protein